MNNKNIEILLVEDDPGDVCLMKESLKGSKMTVNMSVVVDGVEAMAYLRKEGQYSEVNRPSIILLDLNLPKKDGREVLQDVKSDDNLKEIPIVILTTSNAEQDIIKSYGLGANCYITKPVGFEQFRKVVNEIENFWFTVVELPNRK
ncbi:MAG: response regulator [bacterium]